MSGEKLQDYLKKDWKREGQLVGKYTLSKVDLEKLISERLNTSILDLHHINFGDEGAKYISEGLKLNTSITELNIDENNIKDEGAKYISEGLKLNSSLISLNLNLYQKY